MLRLGRLPGTQRYADRGRNPDAEEVPGVLVVRVEAGMLYFNVGHIRDEVLRFVVWDMSTSPYVDIAGVRMLAEVTRELAPRGIALRLAEAHATVRDLVRKEGAAGLQLPEGRVTVAEAVG